MKFVLRSRKYMLVLRPVAFRCSVRASDTLALGAKSLEVARKSVSSRSSRPPGLAAPPPVNETESGEKSLVEWRRRRESAITQSTKYTSAAKFEDRKLAVVRSFVRSFVRM